LRDLLRGIDIPQLNIIMTSSVVGLGGGSLAYSVQTFVLKKEALDYEIFMHKPKLIRDIIQLWQGLIEDVPSLVWGIVGGVGSAVITIIVLKWLGFNP